MTKNKKIKKYNQKKKKILSPLLIILLGVFVVFLSIISSNSKVTVIKPNSTEGLNKNKNTQVKSGVLKVTQKDVDKVSNRYPKSTNNDVKKEDDKVSDSDKKQELEIIRGEVEKSKNVTKEKEENTKDVQVQAANKRIALIKVHGELKNAYLQVDSKNEKQMLDIMISTVGKLETNPSYDFKADKVKVKSIYSKLDADSKSDIKLAIFSNIDGDSITQLKKSFGL
ncbi:hypothetical protein KPL37_06690 [Clostridium frigoris]|uniref:Lipoprotein n=1 Tax=Clostridium frigoris TaxID=205327 RepID=A0ABS6BR98_9CLOT|nr:hypothetical protein [Clostridium frigoris]MBU3159441.1 hypothetical protein [Clostridium frigoris]